MHGRLDRLAGAVQAWRAMLTMLRILLLGGAVFGALVAAVTHLPGLVPPAPASAPADAQAVAPRQSLAQVATSVDTPLGDATFRAWCSWTLGQKLADQPAWTLPRVASLCLCIADRARERRMPDLPDVGRADFVAAVGMVEQRLCRGG